MTSADDIEIQAMEWLVRLDALEIAGGGKGGPAGAAPPARSAHEREHAAAVFAEFDAWCLEDSRRHAAYIRLRSAWRKADQLKRLAPADGVVDLDLLAPERALRSTEANATDSQTQVRPQLRGSAGVRSIPSAFLTGGFTTSLRAMQRARAGRVKTWQVAAAVAVLAIGTGWFFFERINGDTYATGIGGFERLLLVDGSTVELDTDSKILARFTGQKRHIQLLRGQANFNVAHDGRRPFEVEAAQTTVRALGTAFSVRLRNPEHIQVLVTEGRVTVREPSSLPDAPVLSAGDVVTIQSNAAGAERQKLAAPDVARQLSWTQGRLTFDGESLEEAVAEFNRYNPRSLVIADPAIAHIRVGGSFQPTDPQSFITALERSFGVRVQSADERQVRLARATE